MVLTLPALRAAGIDRAEGVGGDGQACLPCLDSAMQRQRSMSETSSPGCYDARGDWFFRVQE